jgi:hypothetical protein
VWFALLRASPILNLSDTFITWKLLTPLPACNCYIQGLRIIFILFGMFMIHLPPKFHKSASNSSLATLNPKAKHRFCMTTIQILVLWSRHMKFCQWLAVFCRNLLPPTLGYSSIRQSLWHQGWGVSTHRGKPLNLDLIHATGCKHPK